MNDCTIILMGATGDLARRKLIPAIYRLVKEKKIEKLVIVGASIVDTTIEKVLEASKKHIKDFDAKVWKKFQSSAYYVKVDFYDDDDYQALKSKVDEVEKKHKLTGNRLFYLATMPEHFSIITAKLADHDIAYKRKGRRKADAPKGWARVVYEKPFGQDLASAKRINKAIAKVFTEDQAYRIDHYLGKELIGNIALVRFTNLFFQPIWNAKYIESVQIILHEKIGIEGRGEYYDQYGALKDVVQNHALQMLALVAMESPRQLTGEYVRSAKANVLKKVTFDDVLFGQYDGYLDEKGVPRGSRRETFVAVQASVHNRRWRGVPFFIKAGKKMPNRETSIHIKFKQPKCLLAKNCPTDSNYLSIRVQPDEGFYLELNAKVPDQAYQITPVKMDFCHSCIFGPNTPGAYEVLLLDAIRGDQSTFVRFDEIELSWKIVDAIAGKRRSVYSYEQGTDGPTQLKKFNKKHGIRWRA